MRHYFKDERGKPIYVLGLQSHNSSTESPELIAKSISAVKQYGGNTLEAPAYWYAVEPDEGSFDFSSVKSLISQVRESGLRLVILWFGFSKNAGQSYMPEWAKADASRFRGVVGPGGTRSHIISPFCDGAIEADKKAFVKLMEFIRDFDSEKRTVIAVQVENEIGIWPFDRCYSKKAQQAFDKGVPAELDGIEILGSDAPGGGNGWIERFGRCASEAFSAWAFATALERIASAGRAVYPDMPLYTNTMVQSSALGHMDIAGQSYPSGAPLGRVMDIWKACAPSLDFLSPDIYRPNKTAFLRFCNDFARDDNPLFIPETGTRGDSFALNLIHAAVDYGAIGLCGFGAESTLDGEGKLHPESQKVACSMKIIGSMSPVLLCDEKRRKLFCVTQEEFADVAAVTREKWSIAFFFTHSGKGGRPMGRSLRISSEVAANPEAFNQRGRAIVYEASPDEFFMAGAGVNARFLRRAEPSAVCAPAIYQSSAATAQAALTIEEGHFEEDGSWVCEFVRNGDEIDMGAFLYPGVVLRVKLNPHASDLIDW